MDTPFDLLKLLRETPEKVAVPGGLLTKMGAQEYVGSVPAVAGTLYFRNAHTQEIREAIAACFEEYETIAKAHLTWLWREEPSEGPDRIEYAKAKPMREIMKGMKPNNSVSFGYISGLRPEDSGDWEFTVDGWRAWQAKIGSWGLCSLRFALPVLYVIENPTAFQAMYLSFARRLYAVNGYGGLSLILSMVREIDNQPFEAYMSKLANGLDVGTPIRSCKAVVDGIKTVSWLTAVNDEMVENIGGLDAIRSALPREWFALYDYGAGIVIQAGHRPHAAPASIDPRPAIYALPNHLLRPVRAPRLGSLHYMSINGEPRITGQAAEAWLKRFDIYDDELPAYLAKLRTEPRLTDETTLPDRL